jgi:hypothetical protein
MYCYRLSQYLKSYPDWILLLLLLLLDSAMSYWLESDSELPEVEAHLTMEWHCYYWAAFRLVKFLVGGDDIADFSS